MRNSPGAPARRRSGVAAVWDLVARARARLGEVIYASAGIGGSAHPAGEMIAGRAGLRLSHMPRSCSCRR